jgi:uncharacterized paraquat-inducible protein A
MSSEPVPEQGPDEPLPQRASRCPQCGAPSSAIRRWPQDQDVWRASCTRCRHAWLEASRRTLSDTLFHQGDLLIFTVMVGVSLIGIGILAFALLLPILGASDSSAFIITIAVCVIALIVIGKQRIDR